MAYKVQLAYFRPTGKFLTYASVTIDREQLPQIWEEIHELRRTGRLPGLRVNAGRDLLILVDVEEHPQRVMHLVLPPFIDEDDVTPVRGVPSEPVMRLFLDEIPSTRTSTRDIVKVVLGEEEVTPVDRPLPKLPDEPSTD
jgi:hypothetical protein